MEEQLKELGLNIRESDNPERLPIDFAIEDDQDNVAWVWGHDLNDVQVECNHAAVVFGKGDEQGECLICGAHCDWHWEDDSGNVEDYNWIGVSPVPHQWYTNNKPAGIIKEYLERRDNGKK